MKVLDLFSGTGGFSEAFLQRGHGVLRIDNDPQFQDVEQTLIRDVLELGDSLVPWGPFDVIVASPPCQAFSLAATGTHMRAETSCLSCEAILIKEHESWTLCCLNQKPSKNIWLVPKTEFGKLSVSLVKRTLDIIDAINPKFYWVENPNGGMVHFVPKDITRVMITQCQYGENRQKLTNLWGRFPETWTPRPRCKNGDDCHESAPRGAKTGTQGIKGAVARAAIPYELSMDVCLSVEEGLTGATE